MENENTGYQPPQYPNTEPVHTPPSVPVTQYASPDIPPAKPKNWMLESILATFIPFVFCCNIFALIGIVAIVNANKVDRLFYNKEYAAAETASRTAKTWMFVTLGVAVAILILNIIMFATGFTKSFMEQYMQAIESMSGGGSAY